MHCVRIKQRRKKTTNLNKERGKEISFTLSAAQRLPFFPFLLFKLVVFLSSLLDFDIHTCSFLVSCIEVKQKYINKCYQVLNTKTVDNFFYQLT